MKEMLELDQQRKWEYLKRYYDVASRFYKTRDEVVTDQEIEKCIRSFKEKPSPQVRKQIRLKSWHFKPDEKDEGLEKGYQFHSSDETNWESVELPHSHRFIPTDPVRFARTEYFQLAPEKGEYAVIWRGKYWTWYKQRVALEDLSDDKVAVLSFDGINLISDIWVNEFPVIMDHTGLFPFKVDITDNTKGKKEAIISIRVTNIVSNLPMLFYNGYQMAYSNPPYCEGREQSSWYDLAWSGIAGATLSILNKNHLDDAFFFTDSIFEDEATIGCKITLKNTSWERFHGRVRIAISKWLPNESETVKEVTENVQVLPMNRARVDIRFTLNEPSIWDPESPNLYLAHVVLENDDGETIDDIYEIFGVRTIRIVGTHFYLNNKKIIPRGTHDSCNYFGESQIYPSDKAIVRDILLHKKMGSTCSRWPSDTRVHYDRIAEYADQIGYMMSWAGFYEMWVSHPEMELYHSRDVKEMIRSLRNRPSIIMWEMADELFYGIDHFRRQRWYEYMYNLVEAEDDTRPIVPAGNIAMDLANLVANYKEKSLSVPEKRKKVLEDFPVYKLPLIWWDYHYTPGTTGEPIGPIFPSLKWIREMLGGLKPTVLTEFGLDGMPNWDNVKDVYGDFSGVWKAYGWWPISRKKVDVSYFGRELKRDDWKETQACQAIALNQIIGFIRENLDVFSAIYFISMFDVWNYFWGVVDANANAKLAYHVVRYDYQQIYLSGLHGNTVLEKEDRIEVTASNLGTPISGAILVVRIRDSKDNLVQETKISNVTISGAASLTKVGQIEVQSSGRGLYSIEYFLNDKNENEIAKSVELFFRA